MKYDYQVFSLPTTNGIHNQAIASGKNYIMLLEAPPGAKVQIRLGSNQSDEIPLKENFSISANNVSEIFLSCNAVPGKIKVAISSSASGVIINPSPQVNTIEEINNINTINSLNNIDKLKDIENINNINKLSTIENFSSTLLQKLDKIINPYENAKYITGSYNSTNRSTLLNIIADFDKFTINFGVDGNFSIFGSGIILLLIDSVIVATYQRDGNGLSLPKDNFFTFKNLRGKNIKIKCATNGNTFDTMFYTLQTFNKKA